MSELLAFDIETYGCWEAVPARLQRYLEARDLQRGRRPDDERAARRTVSLLPGLAQVIAVGLWRGPGDPGLSLSFAPGVEAAPDPEAGAAVRRFAREEDLLTAFWELATAAVRGGARLVSFNGRGFDGPVLTLRSAVLGVAPTVELCGPRGEHRPHCDLQELLAFGGARRERFSLDYWCGVFGVESPKGELTGAGVAAAFERGEHDPIAAYALADARATGELFARLAPTLVPLAEGRAEVDAG